MDFNANMWVRGRKCGREEGEFRECREVEADWK